MSPISPFQPESVVFIALCIHNITMLKADTGKYAFSLPPLEDRRGLYFPDAVLDPILAEARQVVPEMFEAHRSQTAEFSLLDHWQMPGRKFSLQESKTLILDALNAFDSALGKKAEKIFSAGFDKAAEKATMPGFKINWDKMDRMENGDRWRIAGGNRMMRCQPAHSQATEFDPINPNDYAVIDFEFDGTINSVIYMAHEVGHAIADDNENAAEYTAKDGPAHMDELQAYYVQHIVYGALKQHPDAEIATAARRHFNATMADNLYQIPVSLAALHAQQNLSQSRDAQDSTLTEWLGAEATTYGAAHEVLGEIDDARSDNDGSKLDRQIERLHVRPPGLLLASILYHKANEQDMHGRQLISDAVLSRNGPKNIREVLAIAGIERNADMQKLVRTAVRNVADELLQSQNRLEAIPLRHSIEMQPR